MWRFLKKILGAETGVSGPFFIIHRRYLLEAPFPQYDPRRPFRILAFLEARHLLRRGTLRRPRPATIKQLQLVHGPRYLRSLEKAGALKPVLGVDLDTRSQDKFLCFQRLMCGGTLCATALALKNNSLAVNLGGGFHHAAANRGSGFCLFNDVAIAIAVRRAAGYTEPILVVDLDLHDGDGTRAIFADDPTVHTFSIHNQTLGQDRAVASTTIALGGEVDDETYLSALRNHLPEVVQKVEPGLVFYLAGSDPGARDRLGNWKISLAGMLTRDRLVMNLARPHGRRPCVILLAGGYGPQAWRHGAAFFHWLLKGDDLVEIPLELELPVGHYRRLTRLMRHPDLMPDEKVAEQDAQGDSDDWGLREGDLGLAGRPRESRFLGTFSRFAVEYALAEYGLLDRLHRLGFKELRVALDLDDPLGHTLRIQTAGPDPLVVLELKLRVDRQNLPGWSLLSVEWLLIQDSRSQFELSRPLLPGQKYPGLGLLRDTAAVLVVLCERLDLDGLGFIPSHYHLAALSRPLALCPDPECEGRFQALKNTLENMDLRSAGLAVESGLIQDETTGRPLVWKPARLVIPVSDEFKEKILSRDYRQRRETVLRSTSYRLTGPPPR